MFVEPQYCCVPEIYQCNRIFLPCLWKGETILFLNISHVRNFEIISGGVFQRQNWNLSLGKKKIKAVKMDSGNWSEEIFHHLLTASLFIVHLLKRQTS